MKRELDNNPINNEKYLRNKTKPLKGNTITDFHSNNMPKESSPCIKKADDQIHY